MAALRNLHIAGDQATPASRTPFIIGVAGGAASGKKSVCKYLTDKLAEKHPNGHRRIATVSLTDFYKTLNDDELAAAHAGDYNFDHPDAFDWKLFESFLVDVANGRPAKLPQYDPQRKQRNGYTLFAPPDVVLVEGILVLYKRRVRDLLDMQLFVHVDADSCLSACVLRDLARGKSLDEILAQWMKYVKPAYEDFILPTKKQADVIIPNGVRNHVALDLLAQHMDDVLVRLANVNPRSPSLRPSPKRNSPSMAGLKLDLDVGGVASPVNTASPINSPRVPAQVSLAPLVFQSSSESSSGQTSQASSLAASPRRPSAPPRSAVEEDANHHSEYAEMPN